MRNAIWGIWLCSCVKVLPSPNTDEPELVTSIIGSAFDVHTQPTGPGLLLAGGSDDVDEAMAWLVRSAAGGDVIVLQTSRDDGYNEYLYRDLGAVVDSVETMTVTTRAAANSEYVRTRMAGAEAIFICGGDQATYVNAWRGTAIEQELRRAWDRGVVIGGTSAGTAILGDVIFSAQTGGVKSPAALADPYDRDITLEPSMVGAPPLFGVITDTHFTARGRMGRLLAFLARMRSDNLAAQPLGLGIDEQTALLIDATGKARVTGNGSVYVIDGSNAPAISPGMPLIYNRISYYTVSAGESLTLGSL